DDAFVAYLNGHEIARANIGTVGVNPNFNTSAITYHEATMYSGGIPEAFIIHSDTIAKYLQSGKNLLAIQVHNYGTNSSDLSSNTFLSFGVKDQNRHYRDVPTWFQSPLFEKSNLPLVIIETQGKTIVDEPKITSLMRVVDNGVGNLNGYFDEATDYDSFIGIEIRGQSSQMFPKKSFGLETRDELGEGVNVSLLGMPEEEDWILSAPYSDKTMLRNALTYQLGAKMGSWQPRFKFCEVYINSVYQGVYMLTEKIKRGSDRVDVNKLKPEEISGDDLTGGYILKVDKIWDLTTDEYFYTYPSVRYYNARDYAFTYEYPKAEDIVSEQKQYIYNYLVQFQNTLNGSLFKDPVNGYGKYIDINSFVDFQIMNELANNVDGYRYSTFFYKKKDSDGGKLFAGPLWDFNLGYGNVDYSPMNLATDQWLYPHYGPYEEYPMHWWARLMEDPVYQEALYKRWTELRSGPFRTYSIMTDISLFTSSLADAIDRNFEKWPIIGQYVWPNYNYQNTSYQQEIDYLKNWVIARLNWMDANITSTTGFGSANLGNKKLEIYPNPAK
ncbi:MAG: CotH kinase family protein, partial [Bacteroidales bacterium]|nr:CotH kinase family protein [Bacteroidales bacterium]